MYLLIKQFTQFMALTETTLLRVKKETFDRLAEYGDTMDSIIKKLLNEVKL